MKMYVYWNLANTTAICIQFLYIYGTQTPPATNNLTWIKEYMFDVIFSQWKLSTFSLFSYTIPLYLCIWLRDMAWTLKNIILLLYFLRIERKTNSNQPLNKQNQTWPLWDKESSFLPCLFQSYFSFSIKGWTNIGL